MSWKDQFRIWAKPPGQTEQNRYDNAVSSIRSVIRASGKLRDRGISVFTQGSYRNNTNVRADSDVDFGILCTDTFFYDLPECLTRESLGMSGAIYLYANLKVKWKRPW